MITLTRDQLEQALVNKGYLDMRVEEMAPVTIITPRMRELYAAVYEVVFKPTMYDEPDADLRCRVYIEYEPNGRLIADF